ncbi:MAG: hypothetical protein KGH72_04670 [Candidatus Micrarchaeota archaeon]|nr:hypothetical protein [Candidatus Micrarchaeota archaeon]
MTAEIELRSRSSLQRGNPPFKEAARDLAIKVKAALRIGIVDFSRALAREVMRDPVAVKDVFKFIEGRNAMYVAKMFDPPYPVHYNRLEMLPDGRRLRVYYAKDVRLEIHIAPSQVNPIGFETSEWFFRGVDDFRVYNGKQNWAHIRPNDRGAGVIDATTTPYGHKRLDVYLADSEAVKLVYQELVMQTLEVLQGKRTNITVIDIPSAGIGTRTPAELEKRV